MLISMRRGMMIGLMGYAGHGMAFVPNTSGVKGLAPTVPSEHIIREQTVAEAAPRSLTSGESAQIEVDARSGETRLIEGRLMAGQKAIRGTDEASYVATCSNYIVKHQEFFGVAMTDLTLEKQSVLIDSDVQFIRFLVSRDGIAIDDATIECRFKRGELVQIANHSFSEAEVAGSGQCSGVNADQLLTGLVKSTGESYRVVEVDGGYELVRVKNHEVMHEGQPYRLQVATASGEAFEMKPLHYFETGMADAVAYNHFYKEPAQNLVLGTVQLSGNSLTDDLGLFSAKEALELNGFNGKYIKMNVKSGDVATAKAELKDGKWVLRYKSAGTETFSDKGTAQAMAYIHLTRKVNHALKYIHPKWFDKALIVNVNLDDTCNAFWDGTSVNFFSSGDGCANTALISDVMYHEWGHGLHANTGGIKDGAFSEGFGDINALIHTHDPVLGRGFKINKDDGIRDMSVPKVYPKDLKNEVHADGQIIASTFYDLYKALEKTYGADAATDLISKYAYKGIYTAVKYNDMYKVALTIDDNDTDLSNGTPNLCMINKAFTAHGLATKDARCLLPQVR